MTTADTAHVAVNRALWAQSNREYGDARAADAWAADAVTWGVFRVPEATVHALPDVRECDVVELGCGASIWCRPERWVAEAARLLRPGGRLVFMRNSTVSMLCIPDTGPVTTELQRPWASPRRLEWTDAEPGIEFHPGTGEMHGILTGAGFVVERIVDVMAPPDAVEHPRYDYVPVAWAQRWPAEENWMARR